MKKTLTALCLILTFSTFAASGQTKRGSIKAATAKMDGCSVLPWEQTQSDWDIGQNLSANLKKDELVKLLHPKPLLADKAGTDGKYPTGEILLGIGAKPWKYLPGAFIVVLETKNHVPNEFGGVDEKDAAVSIALIKQSPDSANLTVIAKTAEPFVFDEKFRFNRFDLAPYKISETEYAFGLRRCVVNTGTGYTNSYEALDLYRLAGETIEKIFSTPVYYGHFGIRSEKDDYSREATISVAPEKTNGYFNLVKKFGKAKPAVFKWNGKMYQTSDKDPFQKFADPNEIP